MAVFSLGDRRPDVQRAAFVAHNATLVGSVVLEADSSVWFGAVVRADNDLIQVGENSNIQDGAVLHTDPGIQLVVGREVIVGHQVTLHGCKIGDGCLIGMQAIILNHAVIGRECVIGAGTLIPEGKVIPDRSLVVGAPGKIVRQVSDEEAARLRESCLQYVERARRYRRLLAPTPD